MLSVRLVSPERTWIFEKIARKLSETASANDISVSVAPGPDANADINYYLNWYVWQAYGRPRTKCNLLYFTHVNRNEEGLCVDIVNAADHSTTMSNWERDRLISLGARPEKMTTVLCGMDSDWQPRRLRIGITCRFYPDGRRQEGDIIEMAKRGVLQQFDLIVIGGGWEPVLEQLNALGVPLFYAPGGGDYIEDYKVNHEIVPNLDYLWHTGKDTTLGVMDALAAGVPIICQPTGFALDFAQADGAAHWYNNVDELEAILKRLLLVDRQRRWSIGEVARRRTWDVYGAELAELFRKLAAHEDN